MFDRHVSLARLTGANEEYIEKGIPHIAKLMAASADELVSECDVLIVGKRDDIFREALELLRPTHMVVDLARIFDRPPANAKGITAFTW